MPMPLSALPPLVHQVSTDSQHSGDLPPTVVAALWQGRLNDAIRLLQKAQHMNTQEATVLVEAYLVTQPLLKRHVEEVQADVREGWRRWLIFLLVGGVGLGYVLT